MKTFSYVLAALATIAVASPALAMDKPMKEGMDKPMAKEAMAKPMKHHRAPHHYHHHAMKKPMAEKKMM